MTLEKKAMQIRNLVKETHHAFSFQQLSDRATALRPATTDVYSSTAIGPPGRALPSAAAAGQPMHGLSLVGATSGQTWRLLA